MPVFVVVTAANGASAYAAATVVTSLTLAKDVEVSELHGPSSAASAKAAFVPEPESPPVANRYTRPLFAGQT